MYIHTFTCFCESRRRFFSLLSLKYLYISFFRSLPAPCLLPCSSCLLHSPGARPSVSLSPPSLPAFPLLVLRSSCLLCVPWLPLLVRRQAQDSMAVWADAARICPRPCLLLPMCCRVFRCPFRGFRPSVRVCVLLPCVVWWQ